MTIRVRERVLPTVRQLPAPYIATVSALVLAVAVPLLLSQVGTASHPDAALVQTAVIVLAGLRYSWILGSRQRHLHEMAVWLFVYLFLGVAPFLQQRLTYPGTTPDLNESFTLEASVIVLVGCFALLIGSTWASKARPSKKVAFNFSVAESRVNILSIAALLLAVFYIAQVGLGNLFASRSDLSLIREDSFGDNPVAAIIRAGVDMGLLVAFVALMHLRHQRAMKGQRGPVFLPLIVVVTLGICVNPISSARYVFGTVILAVLAAFGVYATVKRFRIVAMSAMVGLVVLFPVLDTFRRSLDSTVKFENPLDSLTAGDFDAFAQIINTIDYVTARGYTWGGQFLGVLLFWVPRSVWPDKPIDTGTLLAEYKGYTFTNLSAPMWAELFINFGWIGLVVGMVLLGYWFRRLDFASEQTLLVSRVPTIVGSIVPFYLLIVLRGSLLQAMANLLVILLCALFVRRRTTSTGEQ